MIPIPRNSTRASATRKAPMSFQPSSRLYLPPAMTTRKEISVASSTMVAKESRKPLLRHMEQKNWLPRQSSSSGKWRHGGSVTDEQLSCRPMCLPKVEPVLSAVTVYDTQCGVRIDAIVTAVAARSEQDALAAGPQDCSGLWGGAEGWTWMWMCVRACVYVPSGCLAGGLRRRQEPP